MIFEQGNSAAEANKHPSVGNGGIPFACASEVLDCEVVILITGQFINSSVYCFHLVIKITLAMK